MNEFDLGEAIAAVLFWGFVALGVYAIGQALGFTAFVILMVCIAVLYKTFGTRA